MRRFKTGICVFVIGGLWAAGVPVYAQAPAGPMTQTTSPATGTTSPTNTASSAKAPAADVPRTRNLSGSWKLNKDESTQPKKRDGDDSGGGRRGGGGRSGGGWPGGSRGGYGGGGKPSGASAERCKKMDAVTRTSAQLELSEKRVGDR